MFHDDFRHFLRSPKFIWLQFAWALWTNIRHVAILRIPWCFVASIVKLIAFGRWQSPIVRSKAGKGAHLAIIGKRELKDYTIRDKAVEHPELKDGDDCQEVAQGTYKMGIYDMAFVCDSRCLEKVKQVCVYGTSKDKLSWFYEEKEGKDPSLPRFCGKVDGFYELTNEIVSGVYIVDEIPQREFLRRIVESRGRYQLESTDWWVTGHHKPDEIIFRSQWSMLKTDSRLYSALPIIPIFLNSRFSKEVGSLAFLFLVFIDLLLPLTSTVLNVVRYVAKTRMQMLVSLIPSCKTRQVIFDVLTGFRPGMKPCLDKINKVVRLRQINVIVFPRENPVCYPFKCDNCQIPPESELRKDEWELEDNSVIHYKRKERLTATYEGLTLKARVVVPDGGVNQEGPTTFTCQVCLHLKGENKASSKQEDHIVDINIEKELDAPAETKYSQQDGDPDWKHVQKGDDLVECTLQVRNHEGTIVWDSGKNRYSKTQRAVLEFYLENMANTFSVEACSSRFRGAEFCVQPKNLFDTLDDITSNRQCLVMPASGNFVVGPSVQNRSRLFRL